MIESYSNNVSAAAGEAITYKNTALKKGCSVDINGATIQFNCCGIYEVSCNATATSQTGSSGTAATITLQLQKDGVAQPQAKVSATSEDTTSKIPLAFKTLVQVPENNTCCPCTSPTTCSIINAGDPATFEDVNLVVTRLV